MSSDKTEEEIEMSEALPMHFNSLRLDDNPTEITFPPSSTSGILKVWDTSARCTVPFIQAADYKQGYESFAVHEFLKDGETHDQLKQLETRSSSSLFNSFKGIEAVGIPPYQFAEAPDPADGTKHVQPFKITSGCLKLTGKYFHSGSDVWVYDHFLKPYASGGFTFSMSDRQRKMESNGYSSDTSSLPSCSKNPHQAINFYSVNASERKMDETLSIDETHSLESISRSDKNSCFRSSSDIREREHRWPKMKGHSCLSRRVRRASPFKTIDRSRKPYRIISRYHVNKFGSATTSQNDFVSRGKLGYMLFNLYEEMMVLNSKNSAIPITKFEKQSVEDINRSSKD